MVLSFSAAAALRIASSKNLPPHLPSRSPLYWFVLPLAQKIRCRHGASDEVPVFVLLFLLVMEL
jgi:hypothetical protein